MTTDQELRAINRDIAAINAHLDTYYASHRIPSGRYVVEFDHQLSRLYARRNELPLELETIQETRRATAV